MNADASAQRMHTRIGAIVTGWGDDEVARAKLDANTNELSGLAVSLQVSHLFSPPSGDTKEEIKQAVAMAAIVRHWSNMQVDLATFKKQTGAMLGGADQAVTARTSPQSAAGRPGPAASGHKEVKMLTAFKPVTGAAIKQAIEGRDGRMLSSFYADDAVVRVIDRNNPPSKPREVRGRAAITTFWDDICGRAMTHKVDTSIADGERLAFTQDCAYPDGTKVFCIATLELRDGKIVRQTVVQAWDE